jgi:hypothetical protein
MHFAGAWHGAQAPPFLPHAVSSLPTLHTSPWQQPVHEAEVQAHLPLTQVCPAPQVAQGLPPPPQAALRLPATHCPVLSQHPLAQLVALQFPVTFWQLWLWQAWFA